MDIEATVTSSTDKELKLRAKWLLVWLQATGPTALGSTMILHKLLPGKCLKIPPEPAKGTEFFMSQIYRF